MSQSTLSVVLTNYNHARFLHDALDGIVLQSRTPDEFIIIDDASTDNSAEIIQSYADRHPFIKFHQNPDNLGGTQNTIRLLDMATGDYICTAGADDRLLPGFFEESMDSLNAHPDAAFSSSPSYVIREDGKNLGLFPTAIISSTDVYLDPDDVRRALLTYGGWFMCNTTIYKREALLQAGGFDTELGPFADGYICHLLALKYGVCFLAKPFGAWRKMDAGYASSVSRDIEKSREIISRARSLMLESAGHLFPGKYVDQWERRQLLWMGTAGAKEFANRPQQLLDYLRSLRPEPDVLDRFFLPLIRMSGPVRNAVARLYLLMLSFTWPATPLMAIWAFKNTAARWRRLPSFKDMP